MIAQSFINQCVNEVIEREGGFVDHPADRGGPTKYGITMRTLSSYRDAAVVRADIESLTREEAAAIYEKVYARDSRLAEVVPQGDVDGCQSVFALLFDSAVNCGVGTASKWLQRTCNDTDGHLPVLAVDGKIGQKTLDVVSRLTAPAVFRSVLRRRFVHYALIVETDPSQSVFIEGWTKRACEFLDHLRL